MWTVDVLYDTETPSNHTSACEQKQSTRKKTTKKCMKMKRVS